MISSQDGTDDRRDRPPAAFLAGRSRRSSVPSWDEIKFGTSRPTD